MKNAKAGLKKATKVLKVVFDISFWIVLVMGVINLLGSAAMLFIPNTSFILNSSQYGHFRLSIEGMINFAINPSVNSYISLKPYFQAVSLIIFVFSVIIGAILYELRQILRTVINDKPFDKKNSKRLSIIAIVLVIGSIVVNIARIRMAMVVVDIMKIPNISINYNIDMSMLLYGFLILILAGIFKYGCYLQEEYDATL